YYSLWSTFCDYSFRFDFLFGSLSFPLPGSSLVNHVSDIADDASSRISSFGYVVHQSRSSREAYMDWFSWTYQALHLGMVYSDYERRGFGPAHRLAAEQVPSHKGSRACRLHLQPGTVRFGLHSDGHPLRHSRWPPAFPPA